MKATYLTEYGPPEVLTYGELPDPQLAPGEVLIRVGASVYEQNIASLRRGGSYVNCGVTAGDAATFDIARMFRNHHAYLGSFMGAKREMREWMRLVHDGKLRGVVGAVFPLEDASEAHRRMEARDFFGKLVLVPEQP